MTARVAQMRADTAARDETAVSLAEVEDVLTEGYAEALAGDAWAMRAERALHEILYSSASPDRGLSLRALVREHAAFQHELIALRRELAALRMQHRAVGAAAD